MKNVRTCLLVIETVTDLSPATAKTWSQILDPDADPEFVKASLQAMLAGYVAITDTWGAVFTPELLDLYPNAIVICTVREPDAWWDSWIGIPLNAISAWQLKLLKFVLWPVPVLRFSPAAQEKLWRR
jgi:Sulfotransferase domain